MMTTIASPSRDGRTSRPRVSLVSFLDAILLFLEQRQQRRDLLKLDEHMLRDIGVTRAEALTEADRFWPRT